MVRLGQRGGGKLLGPNQKKPGTPGTIVSMAFSAEGCHGKVLIGDLMKTTEPKFICKKEILIPFATRLLYRPAVRASYTVWCEIMFSKLACVLPKGKRKLL